MARYLLSQGHDGLYVLSERISQDPLENYFGQQRARGGRNENPSIQQCIHNAAAFRVGMWHIVPLPLHASSHNA